MNKYEYNWATAAMIQGNLKNFRGRARRLARMAENDAGGPSQDDMETNTGGLGQDDAGVDTGAGNESTPEDDPMVSLPPSPPSSDSDSDSSEDDEDNEDA